MHSSSVKSASYVAMSSGSSIKAVAVLVPICTARPSKIWKPCGAKIVAGVRRRIKPSSYALNDLLLRTTSGAKHYLGVGRGLQHPKDDVRLVGADQDRRSFNLAQAFLKVVDTSLHDDPRIQVLRPDRGCQLHQPCCRIRIGAIDAGKRLDNSGARYSLAFLDARQARLKAGGLPASLPSARRKRPDSTLAQSFRSRTVKSGDGTLRVMASPRPSAQTLNCRLRRGL